MSITPPTFLALDSIKMTPVTYKTTLVYNRKRTAADLARIAAAEEKRRRRALKRSRGARS